MRAFATIALGLTFGVAVQAQAPLLTQLSGQQHSPGISWRQIVTPHFRIIFGDSMTADAQRAATLLEQAYDPVRRTLGAPPERIPVLLAGESLVPNAFVSWFPRRTTWHPLPKISADFAGPLEWYTLLAIHEGRHIAQERHMRSGLIGLAARLFGDEGTALLAGRLYFPDWLWEGDAVGAETAMTPAGRGRQPAFMSRVRTMRLTGQDYPHYPAWLGSYRTFYPGHYELGYLLTTYARREYGADVWARVIRRASRNPLTPFALSMALASETDKSLGALHRAAVAAAESLWRAAAERVQETPATRRTRQREDFHIWHWPQYAGDGSIVTAYTGLDDITALVRIDSAGREEVLLRRFVARGEFAFDVAGDFVVWPEYDVHPRWGERDYLTIKSLQLSSGEVRTVRAKTRMYAVALSPDASRIIGAELGGARQSRLRMLDFRSGAILREYSNETNHFLTWPSWSADGEHLVLVAVSKARGNALVRIHASSGATDTLVPWTFAALSRPKEHDGVVYVESSLSGIDNIHAIDVATRRQYQVTARRFGAYSPDVVTRGGDTYLLFRDYGAFGDDIAEQRLDRSSWRPASVGDTADARFAAPLSAQEQVRILSDSSRAWSVEPYRGLGRMFDVHSLALFPGNDIDPWVVQLSSRNVLNTLGSALAYRFNPTQRTHGVDASVSYAGLYPIIDLGGRIGTETSTYQDSAGRVIPYHWRETGATVTARVPLTALRGLAVQQMVAAASLGAIHVADQPVERALDNNNGLLNTMSYTLFASHSEPRAYRDLTGTGAYAIARYRHTPFGGDYSGHTYLLQGGGSLRGPLAHHGVAGIVALEEQRPGNYAYSSAFPFARGYEARARYKLWRAGASYALPLWYPDLSAGPLLFVRRVQAEAFGDYSMGYSAGGANKTFYRSAGVDLTADFVPLSTKQTWRGGVRLAYRADHAEPWRVQFLIGRP